MTFQTVMKYFIERGKWGRSDLLHHHKLEIKPGARIGRFSLSILFVAGFTLTGHSQNIDSLRHLTSKKNTADTTYILALADLAYQLYSIQPDSSLLLARQADTLSIKLNFEKGQGRAKRVIGIYFWSKSNYPEALRFFEKALQLSKKVNDLKGIANCYSNIGVIYRNQGNLDNAIEYYFNSLKIREKIKDRQGIAVLNNNLGLIYRELEHFDKSLEYFFTALKIQKEIGDKPGEGRSHLNIGLIYENQNKLDKATEYYFNSLRLDEEIGDKRGVTFACDNLASIFISQNQLEKAAFYLSKGYLIASEIKSRDRLADVKETYSRYFNAIGKPARAYQFAKEAQALAKEIGNVEILRGSSEQKYLSSIKLNKYKEALEDYTLYVTLRDSLKSKQNNIKSLSKEFAFKEEKIRIEQEKKEFERLAEKEHQKMLINSFGGITLTLTLISFLIYRSNRKIKRQKQILQKQQSELAVQNKEITHSKEEVSAQRDLLAFQNQKLEEAHQVIENQNTEIKLKNETLKTEVKDRTKELMEYNQQLEQFAFISAHSLRSHVARILGLGQLLNYTLKNTGDTEIIYEKIIASTLELDEVVKDLNVILQITKDTTLAVTEINIKEEVNLIRRSLQNEINESGAEITEDFIHCNTLQVFKPYFENILLALISNAIKYHDPQRKLLIHIEAKIQRDVVCLSVSDNGLGMDLPLYGSKLFNLYSRFHDHVEGKGKSLYMVKTQMMAMDGRVEVESELHKGSTFKLFFKSNHLLPANFQK